MFYTDYSTASYVMLFGIWNFLEIMEIWKLFIYITALNHSMLYFSGCTIV